MNEALRRIQSFLKDKNVFFLDRNGSFLFLDKNLWDELPYLEVLQAFESAKVSGNSSTVLETDGRYLLIEFKRISKNVYLLNVEDITREKRLSEAKREIVSLLSHELRTPLTVIRGTAEYLLDSSEFDSGMVQTILTNSDRMEKILKGLSAMVNGNKGELELVNLKKIVDTVFQVFKDDAYQRNIKLINDIDKGFLIMANETLLRQMFVNLVDNALKFTLRGTIRINLNVKEDALISISDTGRGIPNSARHLIFQKYFKSPDSKGHGIGLFLVKEIVSYHGWGIEVDTEEGAGTTFKIRIPAGNFQSKNS